jgi:Protein of unknown function (DUF1702)
MVFRIFDGRGYYDGLFRARHSWKARRHPDDLHVPTLTPYYQGIGRSLLYNCQGKIENVCSIINAFPQERQQDLWRGVGLSASIIGGFDKENLNLIFQNANPHQVH